MDYFGRKKKNDFPHCIFTITISFKEGLSLHLNKLERTFPDDISWKPSLVKIGPVLLKRIFKSHILSFTFSYYIPF